MPRLRCFMNGIFDSLIWGFIASSPLLIGCLIALYVNLSRQVITTIMAFGSGVLITTLTFSILVEAFQVTHTLHATVTGFILGGISFSIANYFLKKKSAAKASSNNLKKGSNYKEKGNTTSSDSGRSLFIGALMDGIPENAALGLTLATGGVLNIAFLVAIFVSNLPEGLALTME